MSEAPSENIRVFCRLRPLGDGCGDSVLSAVNGRVQDSQGNRNFGFDGSFGGGASQAVVYSTVCAPLVHDVLNGINTAVIAYGQTGSGKTYSMEGSCDEPGLIPRMLADIFEVAAIDTDSTFDIAASFVEIYNERINDLLRPGDSPVEICGADGGLYITCAKEIRVSTFDAAQAVYAQGVRRRKAAETAMNARSSRSHAIFILTVARRSKEQTRFSQLFLVDLAGSEKACKTGVQGQQLDEAKSINKSLLFFGNVVNALSTGQPHIPYRNSKLTRLLQNCIGGSSRTAIVVTACPSSWNYQESISSLRFGLRAKTIETVPATNEVLGRTELQKLLERLHMKVMEDRKHLTRLRIHAANLRALLRDLKHIDSMGVSA